MKRSILFLGILSLGMTTVSAKTSIKDFGQMVQKVSVEKEVTGIQFFKGTWAEAKEKAAKESKLIFLDAYAEWCGPCKIMAKREFVKEDVGDFFNANFVNFKMDMEKDADGERLSEKYGLKAYPTLFILDVNEEIKSKLVGARKGKELIAFGKSVL
ncbi:thioredoxin family protein [Crocinitomix catalasitica]|uniref:thioredoxin family protein n=1 Tax=Crocinitomix catalasitica TaxID=184607 RepID=UPI00048A3DD3|nr:thioredoxin domain-containing protein [Crocinitomix catalasitica]